MELDPDDMTRITDVVIAFSKACEEEKTDISAICLSFVQFLKSIGVQKQQLNISNVNVDVNSSSNWRTVDHIGIIRQIPESEFFPTLQELIEK